jgi:lipid-A-disaccharide synthase
MAERGFKSLFEMSDLSVMGLVEVLPKLPKLLSRIRQTADDIVQSEPDVLVTIDSPDFCLRVAKKVKAQLPNLKIVHYVAPSVWAWRPHRATKMAEHVDHVLALLPFEPPYMEAAGMSCDFVGHPVASIAQTSQQDANGFRTEYGIETDAPLLCLLPGSRRGEVARHAPVFFECIQRLKAQNPELNIILPAAPSVFEEVNVVFSGLKDLQVLNTSNISEPDKFAAFAAADAALAVSGTVSLELASQNTPMARVHF